MTTVKDDSSKAAEKRGYSRGYAAGKRRRQLEQRAQSIQARRDAFMQRAFLAVLPFVMSKNGWGAQDAQGVHQPYESIRERVRFGWSIARQATEEGPV